MLDEKEPGRGTLPQARIDVVTVTRNSAATVGDALRSVLASPRVVGAVVVDNASGDGSAEAARAAGARAVVSNAANMGFAAAVNQGLRECGAEYILMLNPDAVIDPPALEMLAAALDAQASAVMAGPLLVGDDGRVVLGARRFSTAANRLLAYLPLPRRPQWSTSEYARSALMADSAAPLAVDYLWGAVLLVRRAFLDDLGGLDERFFLYSEDEDLGREARARGFCSLLVPRARALHLGGASTADTALALARAIAANELLLEKWEGRGAALLFRAAIGPVLIKRAAVLRLAGRAAKADLAVRTRRQLGALRQAPRTTSVVRAPASTIPGPRAAKTPPLLRKYRRFRSLSHQHSLHHALDATYASLATSARYRWILLVDRMHARGTGKWESVKPDNDRYDALSFLASEGRAKANVQPASVCVVVPVYRGLDSTRACLESVLRAHPMTQADVIVVDDASPDDELTHYLNRLADDDRIRLLRNDVNLGFVSSANRGMAAAGDLDVVLLNSDTIVNGDWIDRLSAHAADERAGTVTPFSNNATICSYPTLDGIRAMPEGQSVELLDAACAAANAGRSTQIPTAVGFCMYIKRGCLRDVGDFDEAGFGRGYGEENDFCLRATLRGWRHLLAADTFVWHEGEVSFGCDALLLREAGMEELSRRYPSYLSDVADHLRRDPARPWRVAATAAHFKAGDRPVILMVTHALGGGTKRHVLDLCRRYEGEARFLVLEATVEGMVRLTYPHSSEGCDVLWRVDDAEDVDMLTALLKSHGVDRVHVHHVLGLRLDLQRLIERLHVPFDFTVHDFYPICPRVHLTRRGTGYCGGPQADRCAVCLSLLPRVEVTDIEKWHARHSWLLSKAERVICPSRDTAGQLLPFVKGPDLIVALHDTLFHDAFGEPRRPCLLPEEPLRIGLLGVLSIDKGARLVGECARYARRHGLPLRFSLVGYVPDEDARFVRGAGLRATGPYEADQAQEHLLRGALHAVWFPATIPETYAFTLSEAMTARLPVVVTNIGAFDERVARRPLSWSVQWDSQAADVIDLFMRIRDEFLHAGLPSKVPSPAMNQREGDEGRYPVPATATFYDCDYLATEKRRRGRTSNARDVHEHII